MDQVVMSDNARPTYEVADEMDYREHERTYVGFLAMTKLLVVTVLTSLLTLILFAYGGTVGFWLGAVMLVALVGAAGVGIAMGGSWKPGGVIFALTVLFVLLTTLG